MARKRKAPAEAPAEAPDEQEERSHKAKGIRKRRARGKDDQDQDAGASRFELFRQVGMILASIALGYLIRGLLATDNGSLAESAIDETVKVGTLMNRNTAIFEKALKAVAAETGELETRVSAIERTVRTLKASPGGDTTAA